MTNPATLTRSKPSTGKPSTALQRSAPANLLERWLRIRTTPVVKVYHGYGDNSRVLVMGHVLLKSPEERERYRGGLFRNSLALLRLFAVKPAPAGIRVVIQLGDKGEYEQEAITSEQGFFAADWDTVADMQPGWHPVRVHVAMDPRIAGEGKVYVPPADGRCFVSDIDDTFLISHSDNLAKRLSLLFTRNARTRKPFSGVVEHYRALAGAGKPVGESHPFFYVSSSEWNLYDYLKEFCRYHALPEGVFKLAPLKTLATFWLTGQGKHATKYDRIARIMEEFPALEFILLGDDSQQDPYIYLDIARRHPGRVKVVYIRHRVKENLPKVREAEAAMKALGVEVCYFTHSRTALEHSRRVGLV